MSDVVQRLRAGLEAGAIDLADIMDAADEIERLRQCTAVSDNCVAGNQPEIPCPTNHDAAPAAKARTDADRNRTDKAAIRPGEGTGDLTGPVAWALVYPNDEVAVIAFKRQDADELATASDRIVPLYRQPQPTLTDAEREAVEDGVRCCEYMAAYKPMDWRANLVASAAALRGLLKRTEGLSGTC